MNPHLSIVIPAYNEEQRIGSTLQAVDQFVIGMPYVIEVIVVDDGSLDRTSEMVSVLANTHRYLHLIRFPSNQGKGAAIRAGMLSAKGRYRLFMDADNSTSVNQATSLLAAAENGGAEVVVGSRHVPGSVIVTNQNLMREILGLIFRMLIRTIAPTGVRDTQNGFKLFTAHAAERLFSDLSCSRWTFDVEILRRARQYGLRIVEMPVTWDNDDRSQMQFPHMVRMLFDAISIAWRTRDRIRKDEFQSTSPFGKLPLR